MTNYQLGKLYRIVDNVTGNEYIGSTCEPTLARRLAGHKRGFKYFQIGKGNYVTSFIILENDNFEIFLIENFPCNSKDELHARERHFIEQNECVNKVIPNRTHKEYREDNKDVILEKSKEYYTDNKDVIAERHKEYYNNNKDVIKEQRKQYRTENKQKIKQYNKQYRETKKALKTAETA